MRQDTPGSRFARCYAGVLFAAIAIVTLALGIGAATSIYTVVDGILFRPLPFRDAGRLVAVWQTYPHWKKDPILQRTWDRISFSIPEYQDWRAARQWCCVGNRSERVNPPGVRNRRS